MAKRLEVTTSLNYTFIYDKGDITMKRPNFPDVVFHDDAVVDALCALIFDRILLDESLQRLDNVLDLLEDQNTEDEDSEGLNDFLVPYEEGDGPDGDLN